MRFVTARGVIGGRDGEEVEILVARESSERADRYQWPLAIVVLLFFLRNLRSTAVIAVASRS